MTASIDQRRPRISAHAAESSRLLRERRTRRAPRQRLLIMQVRSGRFGETLMMQCADPNTLPAPSRLHQLEQTLPPYPLPAPPALSANPWLSRLHFNHDVCLFPPPILRRLAASFGPFLGGGSANHGATQQPKTSALM